MPGQFCIYVCGVPSFRHTNSHNTDRFTNCQDPYGPNSTGVNIQVHDNWTSSANCVVAGIMLGSCDVAATECSEWDNRTKGDVRRMTKSANFICRQNRPILSAKIEHVLSLTILSVDFLYIGQQILFMLPW